MIPLPALPSPRVAAIAVVSAAVLALGVWGWRIDTLRAQHLAALRACTAMRQSDADNWSAAYRAAVTTAEAAKEKKEMEYAKAASDADVNYDALRARYAASLRAAQADPSRASSADMSRPADAAGVPSDPAPITVRHPERLADLSAYADACRAWAIDISGAEP